jgi:hypothetical protein
MDSWVGREQLSLTVQQLRKVKYVDAGHDAAVVQFRSDIVIEDDEDGEGGDGEEGAGASSRSGGGGGNAHDASEEAHEAATKVKNIDKIVLGKFEMTTWCEPLQPLQSLKSH